MAILTAQDPHVEPGIDVRQLILRGQTVCFNQDFFYFHASDDQLKVGSKYSFAV